MTTQTRAVEGYCLYSVAVVGLDQDGAATLVYAVATDSARAIPQGPPRGLCPVEEGAVGSAAALGCLLCLLSTVVSVGLGAWLVSLIR